jgi:hypothetical protein
MSFAGTYGFLTKRRARWQTPCGQTLNSCPVRQSAPFEKDRDCDMDIERINQIGTALADLAARTEALRGYL